jgi:TPR repeat protein
MKVVILLFMLCSSALADGVAALRALKNGDYPTALREFLPLGMQGDAAAQTYLGFLYGDSAPGLRNYEESLRWYRAAAEQGQLNAQVILAGTYEFGQRGVQVDHKEAAKWCRMAAEHGNPASMYLLGGHYAEGSGVPQDYIEAHMWFNLAVANGYPSPDAVKERDSVARQMTREQLAEAQRRAREWKPKSAQ